MRKTILLTALAALTSTTLWARPEFGPEPGRHPYRGPGFLLERMTDRLDLSEEQQAQVSELVEIQKAQNQPTHERLRELRSTLHERLELGDAAAAEIGELVLEIHGHQQELHEAGDTFRTELESLLTPEQIEAMPDSGRFIDRGPSKHARFGGRRGAADPSTE